MKTKHLRKTATLLSVGSILPHLFCCALPLAAALVSLGTTAGLAGVMMANPLYQLVDAYHGELLLVAVVSTVVSGILTYLSWRVECRQAAEHAEMELLHGCCAHADCAPKKGKAGRVFLLSLILLMVDVGWYAFEVYGMGLHQHHKSTHLR